MAHTKEKMEELERTSRKLGRDISELLSEGREEGREQMHRLSDTAKKKWDDFSGVVREKSQKVDEMAHEHVWMTAVISAGVGAVIGIIVSTLFRRK